MWTGLYTRMPSAGCISRHPHSNPVVCLQSCNTGITFLDGYGLLGCDTVPIGTQMLMFRRNLLLEFVLRTGLNIRTFIRFFLTAFLPSFLCLYHSRILFSRLDFFLSPFVHIFNVLIYLALLYSDFFISSLLCLPSLLFSFCTYFGNWLCWHRIFLFYVLIVKC
jgi:hypothetical protein